MLKSDLAPDFLDKIKRVFPLIVRIHQRGRTFTITGPDTDKISLSESITEVNKTPQSSNLSQ